MLVNNRARVKDKKNSSYGLDPKRANSDLKIDGQVIIGDYSQNENK